MFFYMTEIKLWNGWLTLNRLKFVYGRESCLEAFSKLKEKASNAIGVRQIAGADYHNASCHAGQVHQWEN